MATRTFRLPDLGEGLTDAELLRWTVAVGDEVTLNQVIAEVETAKAAVELPCPFAGRVVALHAEVGATVEVGAPLIEIAVESPVAGSGDTGTSADDGSPVADARDIEPSAAAEAPADSPAAEPAGAEHPPMLVGYGVAAESAGRRRRSRPSEPRAAASAERPLASPPVRLAARERGIDLAEVPATGRHGEVTREDLEAFTGGGARAAEARTPVTGVRRRMAEAMVESAFTAPHVTVFLDVDVTPAMDLLERLSQRPELAGLHLTPLTLVARALLLVLPDHPALNSRWDAETGEIVTFAQIDLGIAAATPRGLTVPNIKNAGSLGFRELAAALTALTDTAKAGTTAPGDLIGGTVTITNFGVFGVDAGTPILNPGEAAILGLGAIRRRPWEFDGEIALRQVTTLSLSFDHRLVDGEQASRFLTAVGDLLADPTGYVALG